MDDPQTQELDGSDQAALKNAAVSGALWTFLQTGAAQIIRLAGNLILTRLLFPEAFALMALISLLQSGLIMFSDIGLRDIIIRSKRGSERVFLDTVWTLQIIRGFVLWLLCSALAIPFAEFYSEPILKQLIPAVALVSLLHGFMSTKWLVANRNMQLKQLVSLQLYGQLISLAMMSALAYYTRSVWSLALGVVAEQVFLTAGSFLMLKGPNDRLRLEPAARKEIIGYGRWLMASSVATYVANSTDRLAIGRMTSMQTLGIYGVAQQLAQAPSMLIVAIAERVVFPVYSRLYTSGKDLGEEFQPARRPLLLLGGATTACLVAAGEPVIQFLYDERYHEAGLMLSMLSAAAWFQTLTLTYSSALKALGLPRWLAVATAAKVLCLITIPFAIKAAGVEGAIFVLVFSDVVHYLVTALACGRAGVGSWRYDLPLTAYTGLSAAAGYLGAQAIGGHALLRIAVGAGIPLLFWTPLALPLLVHLKREK